MKLTPPNISMTLRITGLVIFALLSVVIMVGLVYGRSGDIFCAHWKDICIGTLACAGINFAGVFLFARWWVQRGRAVAEGDPRGGRISEGRRVVCADPGGENLQRVIDAGDLARMAAVGERVMAGVVIRDMDGYIVYVNEAYEKMTGFTRQELLGQLGHGMSTVHEGSDEVLQEIRAAIAAGVPWRKTYQDVHRNGSVIHVDNMMSPVLDSHSNPRYALSIYQDVTTDIQVRKEMKRLVQIVEHFVDGIQILNDHYRVEYCNPAFYTITGTKSSLVIGKNVAHYPGSLLSPQQFADAMAAVKNNTSWQQEITGSREDGTLVAVKVFISSIIEQQQTRYYVVIIRDVLHEKELEKQVQEAQKMESVGRLAGGIAHDFNNMLQGILGFAELIEIDVRNKDFTTHENILEIQRAAGRARDLTQQLLAFGRRQLVQMKAVNLNKQIHAMQKMLSCMARGGVTVRLQLDPDLDVILADPAQIEQVIMNLVINARDAMAVEKKIAPVSIVTRNVRLTAKDCPAHYPTTSGSYVCLSVADSGAGIRDEHLPLIFEPFFTTKEVGKGTGLGLSVVYGIVRQHNGWIDVDTVLHVGTTFKIYFPVYQNSQGKPQATAHENVKQEERRGAGATILVVDDEEIVRHLNIRALQASGYRVISASSEEEGYACFTAHQSEIQLLFADILLNGGSGIDLADRIRCLAPKLPVLLCSGAAQSLLREKAIESKYGFIGKPYSAEDVLAAIDSLVTHSGG